MRTLSPFLLFFFICASTLLAKNGHVLVIQQLPALYEALKETVGEKAALEFFDDWTDVEVAFFNQKIKALRYATKDSHKEVKDANHLYLKFGGSVFGALGEAYAMARSRAQHPQDNLLDEIKYGELNRHGKKSDGLLYRLTDHGLLITRVLESKMGADGYSAKQAKGYLETWKSRGIQVPGAKRFRPEEIFVKVKDQEVPLTELSFEQLKEATLLAATRDMHAFPGEVHQVPFDATAARTAILETMRKLRKGRPTPPGAGEAQLPKIKTSPESIGEFRHALNDFILDKGTWPKNGGHDPFETFLASLVSQNSGQSNTFVNELSSTSRHYLTETGRIPAKSPLEQKLLSLEATPEAVSTLRAYLRTYGKSPEANEAFLNQLKKKESWNAYFQTHTSESLMTADPADIVACNEALILLRKRKP